MSPTVLWMLKAAGGTLLSFLIGALVKGMFWVKEVKENHLPHIQSALEAIPTALEKQTGMLCGKLEDVKDELKEQRQDIRNLSLEAKAVRHQL